MAYDEFLAERIERIFQERRVPYYAKKMFGGVCHMVDEKMCTGVLKKELMVRIDPQLHEEMLKRPGTEPMAANGNMKGFIMVDPEHVDLDEELEFWIGLALVFNPRAKSSRK